LETPSRTFIWKMRRSCMTEKKAVRRVVHLLFFFVNGSCEGGVVCWCCLMGLGLVCVGGYVSGRLHSHTYTHSPIPASTHAHVGEGPGGAQEEALVYKDPEEGHDAARKGERPQEVRGELEVKNEEGRPGHVGDCRWWWMVDGVCVCVDGLVRATAISMMPPIESVIDHTPSAQNSQSIHQSIHQSINQSINPSIDPSINQSINQPTNHAITHSAGGCRRRQRPWACTRWATG
jgi:hypothetical protein